MGKTGDRLEKLEDKFDYPYTTLEDTKFEEWVERKAAQALHKLQGGVRGDLDALLQHLGLVVVVNPETKVIKKRPSSNRKGKK